MKKDWTYKKLGEVAETYRGLTYSKADEAVSSSKGVLRSNNIDLVTHQLNFDEIKYLREDFVVPEEKKVKKNSIFICMSNGSMQHLGKVAYIDKDYDFAFGGFMGLIVPKEDICSKYVYYALLSPNFITEILKNGKGANINNLRFTDVEQYSLPVPPISIQESIVRELDAIHGILEEKQEQLRELDNLAQAIFYDMFGDPITNPKQWEVKKLGDCCSLRSGDSSANYSKSGILPYVKVGDMNLKGNERYIQTSSTFVDYETNKRSIFPIGTTIFPKRGGAIFTNKKRLTKVEICCDLNTMGVTPSECLNPEYLFMFFYIKDFSLIPNGSSVPQINNKDIAPLSIPLPPLSLQQSFAAKIEAIETQKQAVQQSIREVEALLAERMDNYFG